jgi:hypothetical protein
MGLAPWPGRGTPAPHHPHAGHGQSGCVARAGQFACECDWLTHLDTIARQPAPAPPPVSFQRPTSPRFPRCGGPHPPTCAGTGGKSCTDTLARVTSPVTNPASILFLPTGPSIYPAAGSRSDPRRAAWGFVCGGSAARAASRRYAWSPVDGSSGRWARSGSVGDAVRAESGSVRWRVRAQEFAIARSRRSDVKKKGTGSRQLSSPLLLR